MEGILLVSQVLDHPVASGFAVTPAASKLLPNLVRSFLVN